MTAETRPAAASGTAALVSGRRLLAGIGLGIGIATVLGVGAWLLTAALAPDAVGSVEFTVAVVALAYAALLTGLIIAQGGLRRFLRVAGYRVLGLRELTAGLTGWLLWALATAAIYLIWGLIAGDLLAPLKELLSDSTDVARLPGASALVLILIAVRVLFLAGAVEESLFRGLLQPWLQQRIPAWAAIAITTAVFAVCHIYPAVYPAAVVFGVIAGVVRVRRNTTAALVMHILGDASLLAAAVMISA